MYIIAGLGNPGDKYHHTRHNIGFDVLDALADRHDIGISIAAHQAMTGKGYICGEGVLLVKPMTYMNNSGDSIVQLTDYYKTEVSDELLIVYDDIDLPVGSIRIRPAGSAGGHNGIKSIIARLGTQDFARLRIGVGAKPEHMDLVDHVLGRFDTENRARIDETIDIACDAIESYLCEGVSMTMNRYNNHHL